MQQPARHPVVKVVADSGCQSYILGCPSTGAALLIDPKLGRRKTYAQVLRDFGLHLAGVLDTHTHADHLSDSLAFGREGLPICMSRLTACRRKVTRLGDGDELEVGELRFRVIEVPGHTEDSIALHGHGLCACGDTLLPGSLARAAVTVGLRPARGLLRPPLYNPTHGATQEDPVNHRMIVARMLGQPEREGILEFFTGVPDTPSWSCINDQAGPRSARSRDHAAPVSGNQSPST